MYQVTREEAALKLNVSTRSIDRYIKAGKLRSKKEGKIVYIHEQDIENMSPQSSKKQAEVITPKRENYSHNTSSYGPSAHQENEPLKSVKITEDSSSSIALQKIWMDLRGEIKQKDQVIQNLSLQLGQAQEIAKNSVSVIEFKKSQFLLEESKGHLSQEVANLRNNTTELQKRLKYEKSTNYILIAFCVFLVFVIGLVWFLKI